MPNLPSTKALTQSRPFNKLREPRNRRPITASLAIDLLRNIVFAYFLLRWLTKTYRQLRGRGLIGSTVSLYQYTRSTLYGWFLSAPGIKGKVNSQIEEALGKVESKMVQTGPGTIRYLALPERGMEKEEMMAELRKLAEMPHSKWEEGMVSGAVYHGGDELIELQSEAYKMFSVSNPLHPDVFPGVRKMEAEVVAMVMSLFNAPQEGAGVTTSGGTESILMAVLSARNKANAERGVTEPEMIVPKTVHAAFDKAANYFGIKIHHVDVDQKSLKVDIKKVSRLINSNTIMIVGSAPNFPHGIIDDISALSNLAVKHRIPLHVDCCLGSFIVPFLSTNGFPSPIFDFRLPGVTSISCDTHKYGFAPKGNSVLMYRNRILRAYQYYITTTWPGGVYASPSIAGSRPGALIAGTWTSLMTIGREGYRQSCHDIISCARYIKHEISTNFGNDLYVLGDPLVSVISFSSKSLNIYDVADTMSELGWHLNALQDPPAVHIACTKPTVAAKEKFITDLREAVLKVKLKGEGAAKGDTAALYGVAGSLPNGSVVRRMAEGFIDLLYKA